MAYETYKRTSVRVDSPTVALTPEGRIVFNAASCRLFLGIGAKRAKILWDRSNHKMALKAASEEHLDAFTISFAADNHSATMAAKSFFRDIGWSAKKRETLAAAWNQAEKMLEVSLPSLYVNQARRKNFKVL